MDNNQEIRLLKDWSCDIEKMLRRVADDDNEIKILKHNFEIGIDKLCGVFTDNLLVGVFVLRVETTPNNFPEMAVLWASGQDNKNDLVYSCLPKVEQIARNLKCKMLYFYTDRRGLIKKTTNLGYKPRSAIMGKVL